MGEQPDQRETTGVRRPEAWGDARVEGVGAHAQVLRESLLLLEDFDEHGEDDGERAPVDHLTRPMDKPPL